MDTSIELASMLSNPSFWSCNFSEGMASAESNGKYGFINKEGKFVIAPRFEKVDEKGFSCGLKLKFWNHIRSIIPIKIGYIDLKGNYVWKPTY